MANNSPSNSPFLGGGPKFNKAGDNTPMPGEKVADEKPRPPFGGPRVLIGALLVIVLVAAMWIVYGNGLVGVTHHGSTGGLSPEDKPSMNPDAQGGQ